MSRYRTHRTVLLLFGALVLAANAAHALPRENPFPVRNTKTPECREWRPAVKLPNDMAVSGGEMSPKPPHQADKAKAMQACIRYFLP